MMQEEAIKRFFNYANETWIYPEAETRKKDGSLPANFKIRKCLVLLPTGQKPIIQFNEEVTLSFKVKISSEAMTRGVAKGDPIYLDQIERIETVERPRFEGKLVPFIYVVDTGDSFSLSFDFTPNLPDQLPEYDDSEWQLGKRIAEAHQSVISRDALAYQDHFSTELTALGLWAAPALVPFPLSRITTLVKDGDIESARSLLVSRCDPAFIRKLIEDWKDLPEFDDRNEIIDEATFAHENRKYRLAIYALLPQIEGIITDWLIRAHPDSIPWRTESKTKRFRDIVLSSNPGNADRIVAQSVLEFILSGPVLRDFKRWSDAVEESFPGRHPVGHGKVDEKLFTEENSIKVFLLLDTLFRVIMRCHEPSDEDETG